MSNWLDRRWLGSPTSYSKGIEVASTVATTYIIMWAHNTVIEIAAVAQY